MIWFFFWLGEQKQFEKCDGRELRCWQAAYLTALMVMTPRILSKLRIKLQLKWTFCPYNDFLNKNMHFLRLIPIFSFWNYFHTVIQQMNIIVFSRQWIWSRFVRLQGFVSSVSNTNNGNVFAFGKYKMPLIEIHTQKRTNLMQTLCMLVRHPNGWNVLFASEMNELRILDLLKYMKSKQLNRNGQRNNILCMANEIIWN